MKNINNADQSMSLNTDRLDENAFALSLKHALNENAQNLPQHTLDKLYLARRKAVSAHNARYKQLTSPALANVPQKIWQKLQYLMGAMASPLAFAAPAFVVGVGVYMMATSNADNYVQTVAEIDSQVLTQDLPIDALLDKGFVRYVQVGE